MANPKDQWATCFYCGKRIVWQRQNLTIQQQKENEEAAAYNKEHDLRDSYGRHDPGYRHRPHDPPGYKPRWTHAPEPPGENRVRCEIPKPEGGGDYWRPPSAAPVEFCQASTQEGELCNRTAVPKERWSVVARHPVCGVHIKDEERYHKERIAREEQNQLNEWARDETQKMVDILKQAYGLDCTLENRYGGYTGKVVVDPNALLALLEERIE